MLSLSATHPPVQRPRWGVLRGAARWVRWRLPKRISAHRILSGPLRGKRIVTSWRDYPAAIAGITEPELLGWFGQNVKPGETWLDIGAHYGYTAIALSGLAGPAGRVFAFEPMAATAGCLARTRALNGLGSLTILPFALGEIETVALLKLGTVRGMVDSTVADGAEKPWNEIIMAARFDWLWSRICLGDSRIHGVKIDVQGMELDVLKGMVGALAEHRPKLVVEFHRGVDRAAVLKLLSGAGYAEKAVPIEPVGDEREAKFFDDRSYAFSPRDAGQR